MSTAKVPAGTEIPDYYQKQDVTRVVSMETREMAELVVADYKRTGIPQTTLLVCTSDEEMDAVEKMIGEAFPDPKDSRAILERMNTVKLKGTDDENKLMRQCIVDTAESADGKISMKKLMELARQLFERRLGSV